MIHPTAIVGDDVELGDGAIVGAYAVLGIDGAGAPLRLGPDAHVRSHAVLYRGSTYGRGFHAGHGALLRDACKVGHDVSVGSHSTVEGQVSLGDGVRLHSGCFVPELSVLDAGAWLGPGVIVTNARYPNQPDTKDVIEGVHIGAGAVVGAGCVLLPGISIGAGARIGAGAVVVRDVPPGSLVAGNPAGPLR